jgi:SAM-dependent methyltransferase
MTHGPGSGGYHWRSEEHVAGWDATRSRLDPLREAGFRTMLDQLSTDRLAPLRIVDLGAGDGRVASLVLDWYLSARAVLVDFSEAMMTKGEHELARFGDRFRYHDWDMNVGGWPVELSGPFDAVVSPPRSTTWTMTASDGWPALCWITWRQVGFSPTTTCPRP